MLEALGNSGGGVPIAWDKPDGKKLYGLYADKREVMENIMLNAPDKRWGYEMIPVDTPCLAYADIELICSNPDPERVILSSIISVIRAHIRKIYVRIGEFYIAEGSRMMEDGTFKVSFHFVIAFFLGILFSGWLFRIIFLRLNRLKKKKTHSKFPIKEGYVSIAKLALLFWWRVGVQATQRSSICPP